MRHSKFFKQHPHILHPELFAKMTRVELDNICSAPMWKRIKAVEGNNLAFRALMKQSHGWEMLHNLIRGDHGLPNRY